MLLALLQTEHFKGMPDGVLDFTEKNYISGRNGSGKSSIAEAVLFGLYGKTRSGSREADKLIRDEQEWTKVALQFDSGTTVVRELSRFYGTKLLLNGNKVEQSELDENLPEFHTFLSIFSIGGFTAMDEDDQRELFLRITPEVDRKQIFLGYLSNPKLLEKYPINFKNLDKEEKEYKRELKSLEAQKSEFEVSIRVKNQDLDTMVKPSELIDIEGLKEQMKTAKAWDKYQDELIVYEDAKKAKTCPTCGQAMAKETVKLSMPSKPTGRRPKSTADELQSEIIEAEKSNVLLQQYEGRVAQLEKDLEWEKSKVDELKISISELSEIVKALSPKGMKAGEARIKLASFLNPLKKLIPDVDIQTLIPLKTRDDFKEVFKIFVKGIEYKYLSTGERKRVDIALALLINELTDEQVNMFFLDDAELLDQEDPINVGQVFYAYVSNNELTIKEVQNA